MKPFFLHFLLLVTLFFSCKAKNTTPQQATLAPRVDILNALGNNIMTIYQDKQNHYWFASWEDGLYHYDGKTVQHFTTQNGLPHNRVDDIQEDQWGNVIINTGSGLCKLEGQTFRVIPPIQSDQWMLQPNDLWFKSMQFDGKVYRYDGQKLFSLQMPALHDVDDVLVKHRDNANSYAIYTIYKDLKGNIWFGTAVEGACRFNGKSFDWISEEDVTEHHNGPANGVRSIIEDKDGCFWFNSAYRYCVYGKENKGNQPFYTREKSIGNLDGLPDSDFWEYMSIAKDDSQALWIATYANGVWRYDGKEITYFPVQAAGKDITLFSIYKDRQGVLWLGTHENGVYRFNGKAFERFGL